MRHTVDCTVCKVRKVVNGQKQIDAFREEHLHGKGILACNHIELDTKQGKETNETRDKGSHPQGNQHPHGDAQ